MSAKTTLPAVLQRLLSEDLPKDQERALLKSVIKKDPQAALALLPAYFEQKHGCKAALAELHERLRQSPWHPATFLRWVSDGAERALVATEDRRLIVSLGPSVNRGALRGGVPVFLNTEMKMLLEVATELPACGLVGVFSRLHEGRAVLHGTSGDELVVEMPEAMQGIRGLKPGDRVLYHPHSLVGFERMEQTESSPFCLDEIPTTSFEDIAGLDSLIAELKAEISLHCFNRPLVEQHRLQPMKGVLLCGPPGVGKTMVARALAHHLAHLSGVSATFLNVKPGAHRSMWYGKTEENLRELFAFARRAAAGDGRYAVLFFDDVDQLGARSDNLTTAIDSRVLPSLLHEIDGLERIERVLLIGATNRPDLLDEALQRPNRFGDKVFRILRPDRTTACAIFHKYLRPDLPYFARNGAGSEILAAELINTLLAQLYAPNGELCTLASLTFRDGSRRPLTAPELMSGALIANVVAEAKRRSCLRALGAGPLGIAVEDLLAATAQALRGMVGRLKPGPALRQLLDLPSDLDVVKLEIEPSLRAAGTYEYLRFNPM